MADEGATKGATGQDIAKLQRWARVYTVLGILVLVGLVAVTAVGYSGQGGPGVLTGDEAFFVLGAGVAVVAVASVFLLFSLRHTLMIARAWREAADQNAQKLRDWQQDAQTEALRREQDFRDRDQEATFEKELAAMEERLARRIDREAAQLEAMMSHQEARLSDIGEEVRGSSRTIRR